MASMGMIGALGGVGGAMKDMGKMQMEEAKQMRLENLRASNNRETNKQNQDMSRETNTQNNQQRHDFSLEQMQQQDTMKAGQVEHAAEVKDSYEPTWKQEHDDAGRLTGQTSNKGEWKAAGTTARTGLANTLPADAKMIDYLTGSMKMPQDEAMEWVKTSKNQSQEEFRRDVISKLSAYGYTDTMDQEVNNIMSMAYPDASAPGGTGGASEQPPVEGARKAKDGKWYVQKDGKTFRVD